MSTTKQEVNILQPNNNGINLIETNINNILGYQIKDMFENKKFTYSTIGALICILYIQKYMIKNRIKNRFNKRS
jgi:hypothetical protein